MKFEKVTVKWLGETKHGTSKAGNAYSLKEVVFDITPEGDQYGQSIYAKAMKKELIETLEALHEGDPLESVDIDFEAREYNGWWKTEGKLWRITGARPAPAQEPAPAPTTTETTMVEEDDLPF